MSERKNISENAHPSHPFRNFLYFVYTLINAAAFCLGFYFLAAEKTLYAVICAVWVAVAFTVGIVNAMRFRKR